MHSTKKRKPNEPIAINSPSYSPTSPESDVEPSSAESKPHNSKAIVRFYFNFIKEYELGNKNSQDREDIDLRFPNELNGAIKDESDTSDDEILIITEETSNSAQNHDNGLGYSYYNLKSE
jgi:hypothetical protein